MNEWTTELEVTGGVADGQGWVTGHRGESSGWAWLGPKGDSRDLAASAGLTSWVAAGMVRKQHGW